MSSDGDDDPQSPSAFLEAPSSQSVVVDTKPYVSPSNPESVSADDFDQDSSEEERDNRFAGPASTWRDYTADERALVASLDQERAGDLSIHLYNAHALRSRLYDRTAAAASKTWHSKDSWFIPDGTGTTPWYPDSNWTAWPLRADDVPRKSEGFGKDPLLDDAVEEVLKMPIPWRAGNDLSDEILALMMRKAKERFLLRSTAQVGIVTQQPSQARSPSQSRSSPPVEQSSRQSSATSEIEAHSRSLDSDSESTEAAEFLRAEPMIDDDEARHLLGQTSRHVLTELDRLLMGLHKSRQYHNSELTADAKMNAKSWPLKRKRRSTTNDMMPPLAHDGNSGEDDQHERISRDYLKHPSGDHPLNPRDWSEVIGVAALTGWNPAIVDRAAKRCAVLFGERMLLRTMPETAASGTGDRLVEYVPEMIPDLDIPDEEFILDDEAEAREHSEPETASAYRCPYESCRQHGRRFLKRYEIRQHLRRVHRYDEKALDAYDQICASGVSINAQTIIKESRADDTNRVSDRVAEPQQDVKLPTAVEKDGYMEPIGLSLGRGTDVQSRKRRGVTVEVTGQDGK